VPWQAGYLSVDLECRVPIRWSTEGQYDHAVLLSLSSALGKATASTDRLLAENGRILWSPPRGASSENKHSSVLSSTMSSHQEVMKDEKQHFFFTRNLFNHQHGATIPIPFFSHWTSNGYGSGDGSPR
jgi:hypothetical protein